MLRSLLTFIILLLMLPAAAQHYDAKLGSAPTGFTWQPLPESKAAALLPAGWYYKAEVQKAGANYYLTREAVGESSEFETGFSMMVMRKMASRTKLSANSFVEMLMMRTGHGPGQQTLENTSAMEGPFHKWTVRYRDAPPDADPRIVYQMALANTKTDTLYLLTFESPEKDWPEAWQLGQVMVRELVLDARQ